MAIIYESVQAYRREHNGEVPRRLTELCPRFLDDPGLLSCPRATASGRFTPANRELWTNARHEEFGSYNWEFSSELVPSRWVEGEAPVEWRRVKSALSKSPIGSKVPILRCQIDSSQILNLSLDGEVYASGTYWEERFLDQFPMPYAAPILILRDQRPIAARLPPRPSSSPAGVVDLTPAINACLGDPWIDGHGNKLLPLPHDVATGIHSSGVVFELRGIVQTRGALREKRAPEGFEGRVYPSSSAPIPIARRCARIHLLQATAFRVPRGELIGKYEVITTDGRVIEIPLHAGLETDCWRMGQAEAPIPAPWRAEVEGVGPCALYHWTWQNPHPDEAIATIRLCAAPESVASPFLVAATVDPPP